MVETEIREFLNKCSFYENIIDIEEINKEEIKLKFPSGTTLTLNKSNLDTLFNKYQKDNDIPKIFDPPLGMVYKNMIIYDLKSSSNIVPFSFEMNNSNYKVYTVEKRVDAFSDDILNDFEKLILFQDSWLEDYYLVVEILDSNFELIDPIQIAYLIQLNSMFFDYNIILYQNLDLSFYKITPELQSEIYTIEKDPIKKFIKLFQVPPIIFQYFLQADNAINPINLRFLSFYQIIEYSTDMFYHKSKTKAIKQKILTLLSDINNPIKVDQSIPKIINLIHTKYPKEESQSIKIEAVLKSFIDSDDFFKIFKLLPEISINNKTYPEINKNKKSEFHTLLRKRIYGIRNSIVHSNPLSLKASPLDIFSSGHIIYRELSIMYYICEQIIKKYQYIVGIN